jgi:pyruvate formate lyase activating enzyme
MLQFLGSKKSFKRIHLLPYHKIAAGKYERLGLENKMNGIDEPELNRVQEVKRYLESSGFEVVIG